MISPAIIPSSNLIINFIYSPGLQKYRIKQRA